MTFNSRPSVVQATATSIDAGLRAHMLKVYNLMAMGLALTGGISYLTSTSPALMNLIFGTPLMWVVMLAPVGMAFYLSLRIRTLSASQAQTLFWVYAGAMGISLSSIFLAYTSISIAKTFFITASTFGAMSLWGYTTKKDLSGMGSFLMMGVVGLIIASVVNIFLKNSAMEFVISVLGVLIFTGLTAYDTQVIKSMYFEADDADISSKKAVMGALQLYLDFINLFLYLLRFLGDRRN